MPKARAVAAPLGAVRNRQGERIVPSEVTATDAKKEFGRVLETVMRGGMVVITRHAAPKAVVLSVEEYNDLARATERQLDTLSAEFDALLAGMQAPGSRAAMNDAFGASPARLGRAAVRAARRRA